jgi:hypothetical protein
MIISGIVDSKKYQEILIDLNMFTYPNQKKDLEIGYSCKMVLQTTLCKRLKNGSLLVVAFNQVGRRTRLISTELNACG